MCSAHYGCLLWFLNFVFSQYIYRKFYERFGDGSGCPYCYWYKFCSWKIRSEIHKLIDSIGNKEELPEEWKKSIYKKGDKTDSNNDRGISLLPTTYRILSNTLLSRLTPYAEEIIGDHQCGFRHKRSTTDHILCIRQILEIEVGIKWSSASAIHRLQARLYCSYEGSLLQYSHWVWYRHETGTANTNMSDCNVQQSPGRQEFVWHVSY